LIDYIFLFISLFFIAGQFSINKVYQKRFVRTFGDMLFFPFVTGAVNLTFFFLIGLVFFGGLPAFSSFSLAMSAASAVVFTSAALVGILVMKYGNMAAYSVFMMLGGMLLPYFYGLAFLSEEISAARVAGLLILICALPCSVIVPKEKRTEKKKGAGRMYYLLCACIFLISGMAGIISKAHAVNSASVPAANYAFFLYIWLTVINGSAFLIFRLRQKKPETAEPEAVIRPRAVLTAAAYAISAGMGFLLTLIPASNVPAVVLFPFVSGGTIVLSAVAARIFFGEKVSKPAAAAIVMSIAGTLLFLF